MLMPRPRPRFQRELAESAPELVTRLRNELGAGEQFHVRFAQGHFQITFRKPARRFWSPCLHLEVVATDAGSNIKGMWGPHPDVWTVYSFAAIGLLFGIVVAAMWGLSQMTLKQSPTALYAVPFFLGVACALYGSAFFGQRLARDQMDELRETAGRALRVDAETL